MSIPELLSELLSSEYPLLKSDHDPDIERYYELRAAGRAADALALYDSRLRSRYPDDAFRSRVLRAYRLRDPEYALLMAAAYRRLGERLLEHTKRLIKYVAVRSDSYDPTDVYATIKAAEAILALLPREKYEAIAAIERFSRYAARLSYCADALVRAEELVRAYLTQSLSIVARERERRTTERARALAEERRRLVEGDLADLERQRERDRSAAEQRLRAPIRSGMDSRQAAAPVLDLSLIRFSAADLARIQIPPILTRIEDKALAYCFKYWNMVNDGAFERILFLYSRKNSSKHYDVYMAIRRGRSSGKRDDEILAAVMALLITGYYYSIQGDVYLQRNWTILRKKLEQAGRAGEKPGGGSAAPRRSALRGRPSLRRGNVVQGGAGRAGAMGGPEPVSRSASSPAAHPAAVPKAATRHAAGSKAASHAAQPKRPVAGAKKGQPQRAAAKKGSGPSAGRSRGTVPDAAPHPAGRPIAREPRRAVPRSGRPAGASRAIAQPAGSVADRLKRLSGRSYDVYRDLFLSKVRAAIRKVLGRGRSVFSALPVEVENLVYEFLRDHYTDPFMDWETSGHRQRLDDLGYPLPSVDPVIEECYRGMKG